MLILGESSLLFGSFITIMRRCSTFLGHKIDHISLKALTLMRLSCYKSFPISFITDKRWRVINLRCDQRQWVYLSLHSRSPSLTMWKERAENFWFFFSRCEFSQMLLLLLNLFRGIYNRLTVTSKMTCVTILNKIIIRPRKFQSRVSMSPSQ